MRSSRLLLAWIASALVSACGIDTFGLATAGDDGGPGSDATADGLVGDDGSQGTDASVEGATEGSAGDGPTEAALDAPHDVVADTPCVPTGPEKCTNGIDDDCNGLVDCADPACTGQGYACVPPPPSGWSFVVLDATARPPCPQGLQGTSVDVDPTDLTSPEQCACTCSVSQQPSCTHGNLSAGGGPTSCSLGPANFPANDGACNSNAQLPVEPYAQASAPPVSGGKCQANATQVTPPTGATQGELCSGENAFGGGCASGTVCGLAPAPSFRACVAHGGATGCPSGYPASHAVGHIQDSRGCAGCGCSGTPAATCTGSWTFYDSQDCTGPAGPTIQVDGACHQTTGTGNHNYNSNQFTSTPTNPACAPPAPPSPNGSVALGGQQTVCCD